MTNHRLAVVSDIHGNLPALEYVWAGRGDRADTLGTGFVSRTERSPG